jgi:hypothetical protein
MLTPSDHPFLYLRYLLLVLFLGGILVFVANTGDDVVWWFWFVPLLPLAILFLVDRAELRCPNCREGWALRVKGRVRLGESVVYICRYCWEDFDPQVDYEPVPGQGQYPPARGGERAIIYFVIGMAVVLLIVQLFAEGSPGFFGFVPLFMIAIGVARLKGWVKMGGAGTGGGGP